MYSDTYIDNTIITIATIYHYHSHSQHDMTVTINIAARTTNIVTIRVTLSGRLYNTSNNDIQCSLLPFLPLSSTTL